MLKFQNEKRESKKYEPGDIVFDKNNRRDKRSQTFTKHIVHGDHGIPIVTDKGKEIHKDSIRI